MRSVTHIFRNQIPVNKTRSGENVKLETLDSGPKTTTLRSRNVLLSGHEMESRNDQVPKRPDTDQMIVDTVMTRFRYRLKDEQLRSISHILMGRGVIVNLPVGFVVKDVLDSQITFAHPEALLVAENGHAVLSALQCHDGAVIVDECHKVEDWIKFGAPLSTTLKNGYLLGPLVANTSRLVTKIRWIVESVNGRIKQWKYLQNVIPNSQIPAIGDYVRLVAALCNRYRAPLNTGTTEADQLIAAKMKVLASKTNALQKRVQEEHLERRLHAWKSLNGDDAVAEFPSLSEEELRNITIGVYQLKLAKSYACEHLSEDGDYTIMINDDVQGILRARIQSRHTSSKTYLLWIEYSPAVVTGSYCQCKAGARVVGTCAHVSAVIWYLGYARHVGSIKGVKNWSEFLEDAADIPAIVDESESDDSEPEE